MSKVSVHVLTPQILGVFFHQNCLKTTPIQRKLDCAQFGGTLESNLDPLHVMLEDCNA
jgi:hypothetical protein